MSSSPHSATNILGPEAGPSHPGLSLSRMCSENEGLDSGF